ncbi:uncharacterized protein [Paramisgurnus dabryanus]|uniref:uncharacterized protein isoform X6 n=1 Tax=Paramisgurnus dabryanus TaxID=90735 RepID=UPI0031F3BE89
MKTTILLFIISLFINGVVTHESVSVMEGDSVTLYTNTVIHKGYLIEWRFGDDHYLIARVNGGTNRVKIYADVLNGRFRDRLQVNDQTGDLTFTNITTQHTGLYQLEIINMGNTTKTFNINVFGDKVKTVMMGDSFILHNNVIKKSGDEKIVWRIQHNSSTVAEIIRNGKETNDKVHDERFRGRLKVDDQTGDLIITNITTEDFGSYEVDITVGRHTYTIHRSFTVKEQDSGSRSRAIATTVIIVVVVVLVLSVALAVILYRRRSHGCLVFVWIYAYLCIRFISISITRNSPTSTRICHRSLCLSLDCPLYHLFHIH